MHCYTKHRGIAHMWCWKTIRTTTTKKPQIKQYTVTNSMYTKFIRKAKVINDIRRVGREVKFGEQRRESG